MKLLENELVRKYFQCSSDFHEYQMALRVLEAMEQPIKKGERYLDYLKTTDVWDEQTTAFNWPELQVFHPIKLRLPDRFQPKAHIEVLKCCHGFPICIHCEDKPPAEKGCYCAIHDLNLPTPCVEFQPAKPPEPPERAKPGVFDYEAMQEKLQEIKNAGSSPLPKAVEEKIKEIVHEFKWSGTPVSRKYDALRELVDLSRQSTDKK